MQVQPRALPPTSFFGREQEVEAVLRALHSEDVRLVTLIGPLGVGKTRLALETSRRLGDFRICFVDLSPIRDPALVAPAIAQTLGVMESPDRPILRQLLDYLQRRKLLLMLDNFEQVVEAAPQITAISPAWMGYAGIPGIGYRYAPPEGTCTLLSTRRNCTLEVPHRTRGIEAPRQAVIDCLQCQARRPPLRDAREKLS